MSLFAPRPKKPETPPADPPKVETPAPLDIKALVTEAVQGVASTLGQTVDRLGQKVEELASRQPQVIVQGGGNAPVATARPDLSDEVIDQAILAGPGAAQRIRALVDARVNEAAERVVREHINPLRDFGTNTLGEITRRVVSGGMPHYARFRKEIDAQMAALSPEVRANPAVQEMIYNAVVGQHSDVLSREAAEAAVRQAQEATTAPASTPGTGAGPGAKREAPEVPSAEDLGGRDALDALQLKGRGGMNQDELARSMGYESWAHYQKQYQELLASENS